MAAHRCCHGVSSDTSSPFTNFEQAQAAAEKIVALQTRRSDLKAFGFDRQAANNVTLIPYPDIVALLAPHPIVPLTELDPGVQHAFLRNPPTVPTCFISNARMGAGRETSGLISSIFGGRPW